MGVYEIPYDGSFSSQGAGFVSPRFTLSRVSFKGIAFRSFGSKNKATSDLFVLHAQEQTSLGN
jgi:hypothetical protein